MSVIILFIAVLQLIFSGVLAVQVNNESCYSPESCLYDTLMTNYNSQVRPVNGPAGILNVKVYVELMNILNLDEKNEVMQSVLAINVIWDDKFLSWNITEFPIRVILINTKSLWIPDLTIVNVVDSFFKRTYLEDFRAYITNSGEVIWYFGGIFKTTCTLHLKHYPFDTQSCSIIIQNWAYIEELVNLTSIDITTEYFTSNHLWSLVETTAERSTFVKSDFHAYPRLNITFKLARKRTYYVLNIILPCMLITLVTLIMFWLPPECGEKISLGISVLLAYTVFQIVIMDNTPVSSDEVPFISELVLFIMALSTLSVLTSMLTTYLHFKKPNKHLPRWLHVFALRFLGKALLVSDASAVVHVKQDTYEDGHYTEKYGGELKAKLKNNEFSFLYNELKIVTNFIKQIRHDDEITDEWKILARVIDRLLFLSTIILLIVVLPIISLT